MKGPTKPLREKRHGFRGAFTAEEFQVQRETGTENIIRFHQDQNLLFFMDHKIWWQMQLSSVIDHFTKDTVDFEVTGTNLSSLIFRLIIVDFSLKIFTWGCCQENRKDELRTWPVVLHAHFIHSPPLLDQPSLQSGFANLKRPLIRMVALQCITNQRVVQMPCWQGLNASERLWETLLGWNQWKGNIYKREYISKRYLENYIKNCGRCSPAHGSTQSPPKRGHRESEGVWP